MADMSDREFKSAVLAGLADVQARVKNLTDRVDFMQGDISILKKESARHEQLLVELMERSLAHEQQLSELKSEVVGVKGEMNEIRDEMNEMRQENKLRDQQLASMMALILEIKASLERHITENKLLWAYVRALSNVFHQLSTELPDISEEAVERIVKTVG